MKAKNSTNPPTNPSSKIQDLTLKQYEIRITAKLCIALIFTMHFVLRMCVTFLDPTFTEISRFLTRGAILSSLLILIVVAVEYGLFKQKGPAIIKYSKVFDLFLLLLLMADWVDVVLSGLYRVRQTDPPSFQITAGFLFTSFSWRTLIMTLVIQKWHWKIIAPTATTFLVAGYSFYYDPRNGALLIVRAVIQVLSLMIVFYCEDRIKWRLLWTNLKQEKWMEVNNFILNNLPENIMILDFAGETRFTSDYCKDFMKKCHLPLDDNRGFFKSIQDLQKHYESDPQFTNNLYVERLTTGNGLLTDFEDIEPNSMRLETLDDLIMSFPSLIKEKNLQEREFFVYNGKLKNENPLVQEKSIEIKISFMQTSDKNYIILILRDTTQRDQLIALEETNKYKDQLLASVSHELRAPLNGNINLVEGAINSQQIPESIKETLLTPALQSSKVLLHIINDIIDMSQIKQKKLRLVIHSGDPKETIKSTAQLVELQAKKKGIEFQVEIDQDLPNNFHTDHIRLSQIVLNLLSNAVKFTTKGKVKLTVTRVPEEVSWIRVSVEDSGIGISPENLPKLSRANTWVPLESESDGMGLGLSITQSLVELLAPMNHQNISMKSIPNQGSVFSFVLENKQAETQESDSSWEVAEEPTEPIQTMRFSNTKLHPLESTRSIPLASAKSDSEPLVRKCSCPKVLIVDDNPFNIMALETILNSLKINSDSAYGGSSAIQKLVESGAQKCAHKECKAYSVVFMDQEMPEMNGSETVKEIKRLQKENKIPSNIKFIGCTAHKGKEEVERFFAAGLDSCIYKPVSIVMIKDSLKGSLL